MKESKLTFAQGFLGVESAAAREKGNIQMAFDWDKAATIIKAHLGEHPDLIAEAGLQGDWNYTGGIIFQNGKANSDNYTYLCSNWATPTLILSWDDAEQLETGCFCEENERFTYDTKWDEQSLKILNQPVLNS